MSTSFSILKQFLEQRAFLQNIPSRSLVSFPKNQFIFREGDTADNFYLLYRGKVRFLKYHSDGGFRFTLTLVAGSSLGLPATLTHSSYTASALATTTVWSYPISRSTLQKFLQTYPSYYSLLAQRLAETITYFEKKLAY